MAAPMEEVLDSLPVLGGDPRRAAASGGPEGRAPQSRPVVAYERGEFPALPGGGAPVCRSPSRSRTHGVTSLAGAYRAALEWADEAGRIIA